MPTVTLKAHYDGKQIVLDEPFELPAGSSLIVTVLSDRLSRENAQWHALAASGLERAYGDAEPEYSVSDVKR